MARNHTKRRNAPGPAGQDGSPRPRQDRPRERSGGGDGEGWLWGTHAVVAALANPSRTIHMLLATENAAARLGPARITPEIILGKDLDNRLPPGAVHQGLALKVAPLNPTSLEDLIDRGISRICVLDQVSDPHNLGAIYRSAAAFGFNGIVLQTRHAPPITGVVAKAAVGAIETVAEARVVNIARALEQLADAGYHTVGLDGGGRRILADAVAGAPKIAIVMGAEGSGLRPAVAKACAELARIPMTEVMESLNVSNAAAIAFYEASREGFPPR